MSNHDHLSNIGLHPAYDPDPAVHTPVRVAALRKRIELAQSAVESYVGLQGQTVTVTIGRNVADGRGGQGPMPLERWAEFRATVRSSLEGSLRPEFCAEYHGTGQWQGVAEDSATFTFSGVTTCVASDAVQTWLSYLARDFGQDAIALTIGATTLVES